MDEIDCSLKEFDLLTQDRRYLVDVLFKGLIIYLGLYSFGLNYVLNASGRIRIMIVLISGLAVNAFSHFALWRGVKINSYIEKRIRKISTRLYFESAYSGGFVVNAAWCLVSLFTVLWIIVCIYKLLGNQP